MKPLGVAGLLLALGICGLAPLAFASPPDPLWIGGLFDAGDTDDVIAVATWTEGVMAPAAHDVERVRPGSGDEVSVPGSVAPVSSPRGIIRGRAPPAD
jgi:hypothetical protein